MRISQYNLSLLRIRREHLELVRQWRNAPHVRTQMEFQSLITPEMQEKWFATVDNLHNFYFLMEKAGKAFGVANLKDIDWEKRTAEAGVFVGEASFLNSLSPVFAVLVMMDLAFDEFNLKELRCQVSKENAAGILFNEKLGYQPAADQPKPDFIQYVVSRERYKSVTQPLHKVASKGKLVEFMISYGSDDYPLYRMLQKLSGPNVDQETAP